MVGWSGSLGKRGRLLISAVVAVAVAGAALAGWLLPRGAAPAELGRPGAPAPGTITTVAGGVAGPGPAASIAVGTGPISYAGGALYTGAGPVVRRIDARTGWLTTLAGNGTAGNYGNGGPAGDADLAGGSASAATLDGAGNLLIADGWVYFVAKRTGSFYGQQMLAGHIYKIEKRGFGGTDVRADRAGNLVTIFTNNLCSNCGDTGSVAVLAARTGTFYGMAMRAGRVYTVAGNNQDATAPGNGGPATRAALGSLSQLSLDGAGNILIADEGRTDTLNPPVVPAQIRVVAAGDGTFYGQPMLAGHIYVIAGGGRLTGNGVPATSAPVCAAGVAHDSAGNVVTGDGPRLRVVAAHTGRYYGQAMKAGDIYTVAGAGSGYRSAGDGGPAAKARISATYVAVDGAGNLVFADDGAGTIRVVAERTGTFYGIPMQAGDIYSVTGSGGAAGSGSGGAPASGPLPGLPAGVAADGHGDLIIGFADYSHIGPAFVPARTGTYFGVAMKPGHLYPIPIAGRFGPAPGAVAADRSGNVLIGDQAASRVLVAPARSGRFYGQKMTAGRIYAVAGAGKPASSGNGGPALAAGFSPYAVAAGRAGDIVIVDNSDDPRAPGNRILMVAARSGTVYGITMKAGYIYTVAGPFPGSHAVAIDGHGNILVVNAGTIRLVAARSGTFYGQQVTAGHSVVLAGHPHGPAGLGTGGPATRARLDTPTAIAVAPSARLLIAVYGDRRIEAVTP
jgi:hypothetical protein